VGVEGKRKDRRGIKGTKQNNTNGTDKRTLLLMRTKKRMEKTKQGRNEEKRRIIVNGISVATNAVEKGLNMLLMMESKKENANEE
jgi:hypothetical protein